MVLNQPAESVADRSARFPDLSSWEDQWYEILRESPEQAKVRALTASS